MRNPGLTSQDVRVYIKDIASKNKLLGEQEFDDDRIKLAMEFALDDFNNIPVRTQFTIDNFPARAILMLGTVAHLYKGEKIYQARSNLTYNDAGVSVNDMDKAGVYSELSNQVMAEFEQKTRMWKREYNLSLGWGGFGSEFKNYYRTR